MAVREHILTGTAIVLIRVQNIDCALGAPFKITTFHTITYHISTLIAGIVARSITRIRVAFCAVSGGGTFLAVAEGVGTGEAGSVVGGEVVAW